MQWTRNVKCKTTFKIHTLSGGKFRLERVGGSLLQIENDEKHSENFDANQQASNFKHILKFFANTTDGKCTTRGALPRQESEDFNILKLEILKSKPSAPLW